MQLRFLQQERRFKVLQIRHEEWKQKDKCNTEAHICLIQNIVNEGFRNPFSSTQNGKPTRKNVFKQRTLLPQTGRTKKEFMTESFVLPFPFHN